MNKRKLRRSLPVIISGVVLLILLTFAVTAVIFIFAASSKTHDDIPTSKLPAGIADEYDKNGMKKKSGAYTFVVGGTDKDGVRTDSVLLVYFNPKENILNILSLPRDTYINTGRDTKKLNSVYAYGKGPLLKQELSQTLGIEIDYYMVINLKTFKEVVDLIGGVPMNIAEDMDYDDPAQDLTIHIKQGEQVLNGEAAEGFVRFRSGYAAADLARIEAQKIFMSAFMKTAMQPKNIKKIPQLINTVFDNIKTDMDLMDMLSIAASALKMDMSNIKMFNLPGQWYSKKGYYTAYMPETLQLINQSFNPYPTDITKTDIVELGRTEGGDTSTEGVTAVEMEGKEQPAIIHKQHSGNSSSNETTPKKPASNNTVTTPKVVSLPDSTQQPNGIPSGEEQPAQPTSEAMKVMVRYNRDYTDIIPLIAELTEQGYAIVEERTDDQIENSALIVHSADINYMVAKKHIPSPVEIDINLNSKVVFTVIIGNDYIK